MHLEHHGVKGMKWGVRRQRKPTGTTKTKKSKFDQKERLKKAREQSHIAERVIRTSMEKRPEFKKALKEDDFDAYEKFETEFYRRYDNLVKMDYDKFMKKYGR